MVQLDMPRGAHRHDMTLVVPVYNVEPYLDECLASVIAQTFFCRLEVILVDDGSTDASATMAQAFASRHSNVRYVRQANAGLGAARNVGIDLATAPYIAFLDSDDVLPENSLEARYKAMLDHEADLVIGDMHMFPLKRVWPWSRYFDGSRSVVLGVENLPEIIHGASACNKLFKTSFFTTGKRRFREGVSFEDAYVVVPAMLGADRIALVNEPVYLYRKRHVAGSIMDSLFTRPQNYWDHLALNEELNSMRDEVPPPRQEVLDRFLIRSFQGFALRAPDILPEHELKEFYSRSRAVYAQSGAAEITRSTSDLRHRVPYLAIVHDSFDMFQDPQAGTDGIAIKQRRPHLRPSFPVGPAWDNATIIRRGRANLESVDVVDRQRELVLRGRLIMPGMTLAKVQKDLRIQLVFRGARFSVPVTMTRRAGAPEGQEFSQFEARIPSENIPAGVHRLYLHFRQGPDVFDYRVRASKGMLRSARPWKLSRKRVEIDVATDLSLSLSVRLTETSWHRLRSAQSRVGADVRSCVTGAPFGRERLLRLLTLPYYRGRKVWLFGERQDTAQDNAFALYRYVKLHGKGVDAYYVVRGGTAAYDAVRKVGGEVRAGSLRHKLLLLHARILISSQDIDAYMLPPSWEPERYRRALARRVGSRRVFLQHGVTHNGVGPSMHRATTGLDLLVCSTPQEREYLATTAGYDRKRLALTGMPRFDNLTRQGGGKRILVMPTWRKYLVAPSYSAGSLDPGTFIDSAYRQFYTALLNDESLHSLLAQHDYELDFLPHYEVVSHFASEGSRSSRVNIITDGGRSLQERLRGSRLFVTDFSSVVFDAAYLGMPVIHTPFDADEFYAKHYPQGWFHFDRDALGHVARSVREVVAAIEHYVARDCVREPLFTDRASALFAHTDLQNCERVYKRLLKL